MLITQLIQAGPGFTFWGQDMAQQCQYHAPRGDQKHAAPPAKSNGHQHNGNVENGDGDFQIGDGIDDKNKHRQCARRNGARDNVATESAFPAALLGDRAFRRNMMPSHRLPLGPQARLPRPLPVSIYAMFRSCQSSIA